MTTADTNSKDPLDRPARLLHWTIAILIIGMIPFGIYMDSLPDGDSLKKTIYPIHSGLGLVVLVLALWRSARRIDRGFPEPASPYALWQQHLARAIHWLLLLGVLAMPISGIVHALGDGREITFFGLFSFGQIAPDQTLRHWGGWVHGNVGRLLIALILLHVAGALKHHWIDKDETLNRMLGR